MPEHLIGDRDALAAEYVLGTLDFEERAAAQSLRAQDAEFAGKVTVWERRLGELHLMVEPVEPELEIWQRIRTKLPEVHRPEPIIAVLDAEPELKPELESDRIPEAQLAPAEPKAAEPKAAEPKAAEPEPAEPEAAETKPGEPKLGEP